MNSAPFPKGIVEGEATREARAEIACGTVRVAFLRSFACFDSASTIPSRSVKLVQKSFTKLSSDREFLASCKNASSTCRVLMSLPLVTFSPANVDGFQIHFIYKRKVLDMRQVFWL